MTVTKRCKNKPKTGGAGGKETQILYIIADCYKSKYILNEFAVCPGHAVKALVERVKMLHVLVGESLEGIELIGVSQQNLLYRGLRIGVGFDFLAYDGGIEREAGHLGNLIVFVRSGFNECPHSEGCEYHVPCENGVYHSNPSLKSHVGVGDVRAAHIIVIVLLAVVIVIVR